MYPTGTEKRGEKKNMEIKIGGKKEGKGGGGGGGGGGKRRRND